MFQQGDYVVHRAKRLLEPGERMTPVPGYVGLDMSFAASFDMDRLATYGEPGVAGEVLPPGC